MKKPDELRLKLRKKIKEITNSQKEVETIAALLQDGFNLPEGISNDYLTIRKDVSDAGTFMLFMLTSVIMKDELGNYFSPKEIEAFYASKYEAKELEFPFIFPMIQIRDNQWIGKITISKLIMLHDARLINYNEQTQRAMRKIVINGGEHYQIDLNNAAVKRIRENFQNKTYIPNTLTFNLPEECEVSYDEKKSQLTINYKEGFMFDILDGYHRLVAIYQEYNRNEFDYEMELRIVQFSKDKANQFIWQEDQKTKMKKVYSNSLNQNKIATRIIARLNDDTGFSLRINPNDGEINSPVLNACISALFGRGVKRSDELSVVIKTAKKLKRVFEFMADNDDRFLKKWDNQMIIATVYAAYKDVEDGELLDTVNAYCKKQYEDASMFRLAKDGKFSKNDFEKLGK